MVGRRYINMSTKKYRWIKNNEHPESHNGEIREHILIAEKALGKYLPKNAVVHHVDENGMNNKNTNLVICENENYHKLLHTRQRAYLACGIARYRKCVICKIYDDPNKMSFNVRANRANGMTYRHVECHRNYNKLYL